MIASLPLRETPRYARGVADFAFCNYSTYGMSPGQLMLNILRSEAAGAVRGTLFDPCYKPYNSFGELMEWLNNHIIFNQEGIIIAVFDGDNILWEA